MGQYANSTSVSVERSRNEIERTLSRFGAHEFAYGWSGDCAVIGFSSDGRRVRFVLPLPKRSDFELTPTGKDRSADAITKAWEQACRSKWRALALCIKADLAAVEDEIKTFEQAFLPFIVLSSGRTLYEEVAPKLEIDRLEGKLPPLIPAPSS